MQTRATDVAGPNTDFLSPEQFERFKKDGFTPIPQISPPEEVAMIKTVLQDLLNRQVGREEGALFDLVDPDGGPKSLPQMLNPSNYAAALKKTQHRANAFAIARQILGPAAKLSFEHFIAKPPFHGAITPWHQDHGYNLKADVEIDQISIWMPLQATTPEQGCMRYIPGSQNWPLLQHRSPNDDPRIHAIECAEPFDETAAFYAALPAGGAVVHHARTMHGAGANTTDTPRLAYILAFDGPPRRIEGPKAYPWLASKITPEDQMRADWLKSGGRWVETWRKLTSGRYTDPKRIAVEIDRMLANRRKK